MRISVQETLQNPNLVTVSPGVIPFSCFPFPCPFFFFFGFASFGVRVKVLPLVVFSLWHMSARYRVNVLGLSFGSLSQIGSKFSPSVTALHAASTQRSSASLIGWYFSTMSDDMLLHLSSNSSNQSDQSLPTKMAKLEARLVGKASSASAPPSQHQQPPAKQQQQQQPILSSSSRFVTDGLAEQSTSSDSDDDVSLLYGLKLIFMHYTSVVITLLFESGIYQVVLQLDYYVISSWLWVILPVAFAAKPLLDSVDISYILFCTCSYTTIVAFRVLLCCQRRKFWTLQLEHSTSLFSSVLAVGLVLGWCCYGLMMFVLWKPLISWNTTNRIKWNFWTCSGWMLRGISSSIKHVKHFEDRNWSCPLFMASLLFIGGVLFWRVPIDHKMH